MSGDLRTALKIIVQNPRESNKFLAEKMGVKPSEFYTLLKDLIACDYAQHVGVSGHGGYVATHKGEALIANLASGTLF